MTQDTVYHGECFIGARSILLLLGKVFYKYKLDPIVWWFVKFFHIFAGLLSTHSINCWEWGIGVPSYWILSNHPNPTQRVQYFPFWNLTSWRVQGRADTSLKINNILNQDTWALVKCDQTQAWNLLEVDAKRDAATYQCRRQQRRRQSGKANVSSNEEAQSEEELHGAASSQDKILTNNQS